MVAHCVFFYVPSNVESKLQKALHLLRQEIETLKLREQIKQSVEEKLTKQQRTYLLTEQMKSIRKELGLDKVS